MHLHLAVLLGLAAEFAAAHFGVIYPSWRADTLRNTTVTGFSQWAYPCSGVSTTSSTNRTDWPLTGGSVVLDLHHPWSYVFVNLGLGANVTNFNYTLTPQFLNTTGNGTLCLPKLTLPSTLVATEGQLASLQFVTVGDKGTALYNCADIRFSSSATTLSGDACPSGIVNVTTIQQQTGNGTIPSAANPGKNANFVVLSAIVGLTMSFCLGLSL